MTLKKRVTHYRKNPMNLIQYFLSIIIILIFALSLIPNAYKNFYTIHLVIIVIQILISIFRLRFLNVFFEVILLILGVIIIIPYLFKDLLIIKITLIIITYLFIFLAIFLAIIDMSTFKSKMIYKKVEIFATTKTNKNTPNKKNKKIKKQRKNVKEAKFEEKK